MVPGDSSYSMKFFNLCIDLIYLLYIPSIIHGHEINPATLGSMSHALTCIGGIAVGDVGFSHPNLNKCSIIGEAH